MAKLFIFAIGGTGSRVLKALTMLLASGVKMDHTEAVIPIIIDPDSANGDLTRTEEIVRLYRSIHKKTICNKSFFYKTPIKSLDEIKDTGFVSDKFRFEVDGVKDSRFRDFIGYAEMDSKNKAFASLLFSKDNLEANMEVGFKGNPNIGSVVLNKFRESEYFQDFAQSFGENDRVFIISSIFGGTGAAGFPIILKNIRGAQPPVPNHASLQKAKIGAITVMPYFSVNDTGTKTDIDSNTFISKTKAALSYYALNVSGNNSLNRLYYIGDEFANNRQKGADGAADQKNEAHFVELASALAIIDFMNTPDDELAVANGVAVSPRYLEYGLANATSRIEFKDLAHNSQDAIAAPLTQYTLFEIFFRKYLDETSSKIYAENGVNKIKREALDSRFNNDLQKFNTHFEDWLAENERSSVSFVAINKGVQRGDILNLVTGSPEKISKINPFEKKGLEAFVEELARTDSKENFDALGDSNKKILATFAHATENIVKKRLNIK